MIQVLLPLLGLWEETDFRYTKEFIWNFDIDKSHWYHYNKDDMVESENENDNDEKDIDDMGNDQDDLEISDEEKPDISGLFAKQDNKGLLIQDNKEKTTEIKNEIVKEENKEEEKEKESGEKFYKVIEQEKVDLKNNELNPIGFKYNINPKDENKQEKVENENNKDDNNNEKENEEDNEEEEEDIENINKNIFN